MLKILPTIIISLFLATISSSRKRLLVDEYGNETVLKDRFFFVLLVVVLGLFAGLRTHYNDTATYISGYLSTPNTLSAISDIDWLELDLAPSFTCVSIILRSLGVSQQGFLLFFAFITNAIYLWFLREYADDFSFSFLIFLCIDCYVFTFAAIKQCIAIAICLIAVDRALKEKWMSFVLLVIIATTFHMFSFIYVFVPLLLFSPWTKRTVYMVVITLVVALSLDLLTGSISQFMLVLGKEEYTVEEISRKGVNIFRVFVCMVPLFASFISRKCWNESTNKQSNLFLNLCIVNALIMFVALFGTGNLFARLSYYFLIFQALGVPIALRRFCGANDSQYRTIKTIACICYLLFFAYSLLYSNGGLTFDRKFRNIDFFTYLKGIL